MREATGEQFITTEQALEYCKAIYNAETEEEIEYVKQDMTEYLRQNGLNETFIQDWIQQLEMLATKLENEEIVFDENGNLVKNETPTPTQESVEVNGLQPTTINSQANTLAGIVLGVVGAAIVTSLVLKRKCLKNKKNRTR